MKMARVIKEKEVTYWIDGSGAKVPVQYVPADEKKRDKVVNRIFRKVDSFQERMKKMKLEIEAEMKKYLSQIAGEYGENWEGNCSIYDFGKEKQIEIKVAKKFVFNEKLQIAKQKIDSCIKEWSEGSSQKMLALINKAFRVDKKGQVDTKMILGLRELNIKDKMWKEAMELINEAITVDSSKIYYNFRHKDESGQWKIISLNFSAI